METINNQYKDMIQAQQASNVSLYANPKADMESAMIRLVDTSKELEDFENYLRQRRKLSNGTYQYYGTKLMTEDGINEVLSMIDSINKHTIMGKVSDREIQHIIDYLADNLAKILMVNKKKYGIDDTTRSIIYHKSIMFANQILHRGLDGGDRGFWKGTVQEIKTTVDNSQKKKGFFSFANPN